MTNTDQEFNAWSTAHPYDTGWPAGSEKPSSWSQKCVAFVHRAGNFSSTADTARLVREATQKAGHQLYTTAVLPISKIPVGWFVHFKLGTDDHIGKSVGNGKFLSATEWVSGAVKRGVLGIVQYEQLSGATYEGATPYFINQTLEGVSTALPKPPTPKPKALNVRAIATYLWNNGYGKSMARYTGIRGPIYWRGVQTWGARHGMYPQPGYKINGIPGPQTRKVEAYLNEHL